MLPHETGETTVGGKQLLGAACGDCGQVGAGAEHLGVAGSQHDDPHLPIGLGSVHGTA